MAKKKKRKTDGTNFENMVKEMESALDNDSWMVCIFSMNGTQLRLFRKTGGDPGFPVDDFATAVDLLDGDLRAERDKVEAADAPTPVMGKTS